MSDPLKLSVPGNEELLPALEWRARMSQTFLRTAHDCRRAAYLYVKHDGGTPAVPLDRGTLGHAVFQRMTMILLEQGERAFLDESELAMIRKGGDPQTLAGQTAAITAAIVDEVARERPDLPVPFDSIDLVRVMAWHWAVGMEVNVEHLIAIERKFVLDVGGRVLSGQIDLAELDPDTGVVDISDYKTQIWAPDQEQFDASFQTKFYSALIAFGRPVERVPCPECDGSGIERHGPGLAERCCVCKGRQYTEVLGDPVAPGVNFFRGRELYPRRALRKTDGKLDRRETVRTRTELADFLVDLERLLDELDEKMTAPAAAWPARSGSHCTYCPAKLECPLPPVARELAGTISSVEDAARFAEAIDRHDALGKAYKKELRNFLKALGEPVRFGKDGVVMLAAETKTLRDYAAMERDAQEAALYGRPFEVRDYVREQTSTAMRFRRLTAEELEAEAKTAKAVTEEDRDSGTLDERFGSDAPF